MTGPRETAAEALADDWNPSRDPVLTAMFRDYAVTALASLAQHRDDIARVQMRHMALVNDDRVTECACGAWPLDERDDVTWPGFHRHQADAVLAYLTGEAS